MSQMQFLCCYKICGVWARNRSAMASTLSLAPANVSERNVMLWFRALFDTPATFYHSYPRLRWDIVSVLFGVVLCGFCAPCAAGAYHSVGDLHCRSASSFDRNLFLLLVPDGCYLSLINLYNSLRNTHFMLCVRAPSPAAISNTQKNVSFMFASCTMSLYTVRLGFPSKTGTCHRGALCACLLVVLYYNLSVCCNVSLFVYFSLSDL